MGLSAGGRALKKHIGTAFAPGHLTAFFRTAATPEDPLHRGSLGGGICLSLGATTRIQVSDRKKPSDPNGPDDPANSPSLAIRITINDQEREAAVSRSALTMFLHDVVKNGWLTRDQLSGMEFSVSTTLELPEQSGWGMSGAGALSSVLALREALNIPYSFHETIAFAHLSELEHSTGLGDVAAQCAGGIEIRKRPGIQPYGSIDSIPCEPLVIVCLTIPDPLSTAGVLSDKVLVESLNTSGRVAMDGISHLPTLDMFLELSRKFTLKTGIADLRILHILEQMRKMGIGEGGMAMLGNSIYAVGDTAALVELFESYGRVDVCGIDHGGARVIASAP
jgi:pantoate kinase